jgi:hypothetical protein
MNLLGGEIYLDSDYNSGIEGCPGARFVISLMKRPLTEEVLHDHTKNHFLAKEGSVRTSFRKRPSLEGDASQKSDSVTVCKQLTPFDLPKRLSVLFVDDDAMLRKVSRWFLHSVPLPLHPFLTKTFIHIS